MNHGLIGNWSPGIGDPTIGGWITVVLYVVAAWTTWRLLREWNEQPASNTLNEHWFWKMLFVGLVLLGINKQLDMQSAFTEIGRIMAAKEGWYANRQQVQIAFIAGIVLVGLALFTATLHMTWGAPRSTIGALVGSTGLLVFVIIRAASFHHVDDLLGHSLSGLRINWLLEMGALLMIIGSTWQRRGQHSCA